MTAAGLNDLRHRLCEAYVGLGEDEATGLVFRGDVRPLLRPPEAGPVVGGGGLVRLLQTDGTDAERIDNSPEQRAFADAAGVTWVGQGDPRAVYLTLVTRKGAVNVKSADS